MLRRLVQVDDEISFNAELWGKHKNRSRWTQSRRRISLEDIDYKGCHTRMSVCISQSDAFPSSSFFALRLYISSRRAWVRPPGPLSWFMIDGFIQSVRYVVMHLFLDQVYVFSDICDFPFLHRVGTLVGRRAGPHQHRSPRNACWLDLRPTWSRLTWERRPQFFKASRFPLTAWWETPGWSESWLALRTDGEKNTFWRKYFFLSSVVVNS